MPTDYELYYGFSRFAIELNELCPELKELLPPTDARFRLDQRYMQFPHPILYSYCKTYCSLVAKESDPQPHKKNHSRNYFNLVLKVSVKPCLSLKGFDSCGFSCVCVVGKRQLIKIQWNGVTHAVLAYLLVKPQCESNIDEIDEYNEDFHEKE